MKKIFGPDVGINFPHRSMYELRDEFLTCDYSSSRTMTVIALSQQMDERYNEISELLLFQLNNKIHFMHYGFGIESAWTIAICFAVNLQEKD